MENTYCVYKHTVPNGKVYIGITCRNPEVRWRKDGSGYKSSPYFYSAIKKYGWENIKHEIIETGLCRDSACEEEKRLIAQHNSSDRSFGYNQTFGGDVGLKITEEIKQKISEAKKKFYLIDENRELVRRRMSGIKRTDDTKRKISEVKTGSKNPHSEQWKQKISDLARTRFYADEKYQTFMKNGIAAAKCNSKQVIQYNLDMVEIARYESTKEAQRRCGVNSGNISKCCNGKIKTAGGYIWRYVS